MKYFKEAFQENLESRKQLMLELKQITRAIEDSIFEDLQDECKECTRTDCISNYFDYMLLKYDKDGKILKPYTCLRKR